MESVVLSVCRGDVREHPWEGRTVRSAIFKSPAEGPVRATATGLEGDRQADGRVHGGPEKAILVYASAHDAFWTPLLGHAPEAGQFGQNLTIAGGATEDAVRIGDAFRCGGAVLRVTRPRGPCFKIGIRLGDPALADAYFGSGRWGFYVAVEEEGPIAAGDPWTLLRTDPAAPLLADVIAEKRRAKKG